MKLELQTKQITKKKKKNKIYNNKIKIKKRIEKSKRYHIKIGELK